MTKPVSSHKSSRGTRFKFEFKFKFKNTLETHKEELHNQTDLRCFRFVVRGPELFPISHMDTVHSDLVSAPSAMLVIATHSFVAGSYRSTELR